MVAAGEVEGFPVGAAKGEIGSGGCPVDDAAELVAVWLDDPQAAGAAAIDVALDIDLHPVRDAGLVAAQIGKDPVGLLGQGAVGGELEHPDMPPARIIDVEKL